MKITLKYNGDQKVELPERYEDFLKKMKEFDIPNREFIYVNDKKEKSEINNAQTYSRMRFQVPSQHNPCLKVIENKPKIPKKKQESSEYDEGENLKLIKETDFVDIFYNNAESIPCQCQFSHKSTEKCPYCNDSKKISMEGFKGELKQQFIDYFSQNFIMLKDYIEQNFKIKINSFSEWLLLHQQLVNFDIQEEFLFKCINCKNFKSNQHSVYVQQCTYPQEPVCTDCFKKQVFKFQHYKELISIKDDFKSLKMPRLKN